jgi:hypothetical protein
MAALIDHVNALQVEIVNLEFQKEIHLHSMYQEDLLQVRDEITAREAQIAGLRGRLNQLISALPETERLALASATHNQQTHPLISSLPYELLSDIFGKGPIDPQRRTTFALSVSQVSRQWREVAIRTPFLWSGICLFPWRTQGGYHRFLQILLERFHGHLLDIKLTLRDSQNPNGQANRMRKRFDYLNARQNSDALSTDFLMSFNEPIVDHCLQAQLNMFIPEVSRWRTFNYECDESNDVSQVTNCLAYLSAPILESFHIITSGSAVPKPIKPLKIFDGGAPKLSLIHIRGTSALSCLPPLSSVTTLHLDASCMEPIGGAEFLQMLKNLQTLASLHLDGIVVDPYDLYLLAVQGIFVEISTLRFLSFSANASPKYCIESILNTIRCPAIESMTISGLEDVYSFARSGMHPLPLPPFPSLRTMELNQISCSKLANNFDFSHFFALHTISLTDCTSVMALLRLLLPTSGGADRETVWPLLRVIELTHVGAKEVDGICKIIWHRQACGKPIEAIVLDPVSLDRFPERVDWMEQHVVVRRGRFVFYPEELTAAMQGFDI